MDLSGAFQPVIGRHEFFARQPAGMLVDPPPAAHAPKHYFPQQGGVEQPQQQQPTGTIVYPQPVNPPRIYKDFFEYQAAVLEQFMKRPDVMRMYQAEVNRFGAPVYSASCSGHQMLAAPSFSAGAESEATAKPPDTAWAYVAGMLSDGTSAVLVVMLFLLVLDVLLRYKLRR